MPQNLMGQGCPGFKHFSLSSNHKAYCPIAYIYSPAGLLLLLLLLVVVVVVVAAVVVVVVVVVLFRYEIY